MKFYTKNHGANIYISKDGSTARRISWGMDEGVVFSERPIQVDEKVCLRLTIPWNGEIRFGLTLQDPSEKLRSLAQQWAMYIVHTDDDYTKTANILYYHVNKAGQVFYAIDGEDKGCLFSGVPVERPLWAILDIYRLGTTVQFLNSKALNQELIKEGISGVSFTDNLGGSVAERDRAKGGVTSRVAGVTPGVTSQRDGMTPDVTSRRDGVTSYVTGTAGRVGALKALTSYSPFNLQVAKLIPLRFVKVDDNNASISSDGTEAMCEKDKCNVFSKRPVMINEKVCFRITSIMPCWPTGIQLGITGLPPPLLAPSRYHTKPVDSAYCKLNNILHYYVTSAGDVIYGVNGEDKGILFSGVVMRSQLWALVVIEGRGANIKLMDLIPFSKAVQKLRTDDKLVTSPFKELGMQGPAEKVEGAKIRSDRFGESSKTNVTCRVDGVTNVTSRDVGVTTTAGRCDAANNITPKSKLPPLSFHNMHGSALRTFGEGSVVERTQPGVQDGDAFTARPVRVNEEVHLRLINVSAENKATIYFGYTARNPATLKHSVPKKQMKTWVMPLAKKFHLKNNIISYTVHVSGMICFAVNHEIQNLLSSKVDTTCPLWVMVKINGLGTAIRFEDASNMQNTRVIPSPVEQRIGKTQLAPWPSSYQGLSRLRLHTTKGRNIQLRSEFASRKRDTFRQGYVFTALPMLPSQSIVIQILSVRAPADRVGGLAYGLTSCDPATLRETDLPNDNEQLLDRPEYWVVRQHAGKDLRAGEELGISLSLNGQVQESRNNSDPITVMHVDHTLKLWAFVDLYETTERVRMFTTPVESPLQQSGSAVLRQGFDWSTVFGQPRETKRLSKTVRKADRFTVAGRDVGATTSVAERDVSTSSDASRASTVTATRARPQQRVQMGTALESLEQPSTSRQYPDSKPDVVESQQSNRECSVCFDRQIDCALYKCGHMCACYTCALQLWQDGGGRCPICRAEIKEVMRIFKS